MGQFSSARRMWRNAGSSACKEGAMGVSHGRQSRGRGGDEEEEKEPAGESKQGPEQSADGGGQHARVCVCGHVWACACVGLCVCAGVCVCVCMCESVCAGLCLCVSACVSVRMCVCVCVCACVCVWVYPCDCVSLRVYVCVCVSVRVVCVCTQRRVASGQAAKWSSCRR